MHTSVAAEIKVALDAEQRSQAWLAARLGISRNAMKRKLEGDVDFSVEQFLAASEALHIDPSAVIKSLTEVRAA